LKAEMYHRNRISPPGPVAEPNFDELIDACKEHIETIVRTGNRGKHDEHYIYELAVEAVFGEGIFDWMVQRTEDED